MNQQDLPDLSSTINVPAEAIESFQRLGHCVIRGLFKKAELQPYAPIVVERAKKEAPSRENIPGDNAYTREPVLVSDNLWESDPRIKRLAHCRRIAAAAAAVMKVHAVRFYQDQEFIKAGPCGPTPWHQDLVHWPIEGHHVVTVWMPLADLTADMGTLTFCSNSHRGGDLGNLGEVDDAQRVLSSRIRAGEWQTVNYGALELGDATIHHGWLLHGSPPNATQRERPAFTVAYMADGTKIRAIDDTNRGDHISRLDSLPPGSVAMSDKMPVVFTSER